MTPSKNQGEGDHNEIAPEHLSPSADDKSTPTGSRTFQRGRFVIMSEIGEGAAGTVSRAFDTVLGRNCAIKCLHNKNRGERQILRFQREARASSRLKHAGIVEIYDFGVSEDGAPYLVMEYVEGLSLVSYLEDKGRLPIPQAVRIAGLIANAMAHAHANNVIHRDLKPSNVILIATDSSIEDVGVKIVDFGIAAVIDGETIGKTITPSQGLTGSPYYMSPEQASRVGIDPRTDIYSLGCMLFELLVGQKPYCGETALSTIEMHCKTPVPLAHLVAPNFKIPEPLSRLVQKMMAKSKDERVLTMPEVVAQLKPYENTEQELETQPGIAKAALPERPKQPRSRKKILATASAIFLVCLIGTWLAPYVVQEMKKPMFSLPEQKPIVESNEAETDFQSLGRLVGLTQKQRETIGSKQYHLFRESITDNAVKGILLSGCEPPTDILISRAGITRESLKIIAKCPTVETLHLDYCQKLPESALVELLPMKKLQVLSLRGANITDKSMDLIAKIPSLNLVIVSDNPRVTISGVLKLANLPVLYSLGVGNTGVKGSDYLALNAFKHLIILSLDHARVSDEDLASIGKLKFLQRVTLTESTVSESGILPLAEIPSLHSLRMADCKGPSIKTMFVLKNKVKRRCLIEEKRPYGGDERLYKR